MSIPAGTPAPVSPSVWFHAGRWHRRAGNAYGESFPVAAEDRGLPYLVIPGALTATIAELRSSALQSSG